MLIQNPNNPAYLNAATKAALNPLRLPKGIQRAFDIRNDIFNLATQYGTPKESGQTTSFCLMLESGIFVMYDIPKEDVEAPFELNNTGSPLAARVWDNDELVFTMQWTWRGVFQVGLFEKGPWIKQIRKALARPDLHLI